MKQERTITEWLRSQSNRVLRGVSRLWTTPDKSLTTLSIIIGLITGLGALGFSKLILWGEKFYFEHLGTQLHEQGLFLLLLPLLPMSGAVFVGLITYYFAPEAEGHGVPEVMDAMARKGGRIRPRVAGAKAVSSALTIGSGGSAGTEGPIIQIGAAIGSGFGQWLGLSLSDIRVLIGCGTAAGIAAIFNAPIAGVLFAVEVLLRDVSLRSFVPIIISAVLSATVTQGVAGNVDPIFPVPAEFIGGAAEPVYKFTVQEIGNYALLGVVCGLVAVGFVKLLYFSEDTFRKLPIHRVLRPVFGALLLGLLTVATASITHKQVPHVQGVRGPHGVITAEEVPLEGHPPAIMGNGYPVIRQTLEPLAYNTPAHIETNPWELRLLVILLIGKVLATCLTLGSGGSGGVFAPSLFIGATTGGAFGLIIQHTGWFPDVSPGAYALVGMAAVVAASIHAPLTATLILFELTRDYNVIVPIMLAAVVGLAVAQRIEFASIYTLKLLRRGIRFGSAGDLRLLQRLTVRDVPRLRAPMVTPQHSIDVLVAMMRSTSANDFVVTDDKGRLAGMVLGDDLRTMLLESEAIPLLTVSDIMRKDLPAVRLDDTLDQVLDRFAGQPMSSLPVVDPEEPDRVRELVTRSAVMNRYHRAIESIGSNPA